MENERKARQRRAKRDWVWRNVEKVRATARKAMKSPEERHRYYMANRDYFLARQALRRTCRPDLPPHDYRWWKPLRMLPPPSLPQTRAEATRLYIKKLKELRIAFGRDPITGRKKKNGD